MRCRVDWGIARLLFFSVAYVVGLGRIAGAPPNAVSVSPRVWQIGSTVELICEGENLAGLSAVLLGEWKLVPNSEPRVEGRTARVVVDVPGDLPQGLYPLWVVTPSGVSVPTAVRLTAIPAQSWIEPLSTLPIALHGKLPGSTVLKTRLDGKQGQRLVLDIEARRWGSKVRPVIRVLDPRGTQIAFDQGALRRSGDARCEVTLPQDGTYSIVLHDLLFRGENPSDFVLFIGDLATADMIYPLAVRRGTEQEVQWLGGSLHGTRILLAARSEDWRPFLPLRPPQEGYAGEPMAIAITDEPHWSEEQLADTPRRWPEVPGGVSGILTAAGEVDRYALPVSPGAIVRVECFADRLGSPLDAVLVVQTEDGRVLVRGDDQPNTPDPVVEFQAPDNVSLVHLSVSDLTGRGGPAYAYRLMADLSSRPRVNVSIDTQRIVIPAGGSALLAVEANRRAYDGPVELHWQHLPEGVRVSGALIAPSNNRGLVVLSADRAIEPQVGFVSARLLEAEAPPSVALTPDAFVARHHPWMQWYLAVSTGEPAPLRVVWIPGTDDRLKQGESLPAKVRLEPLAAKTGKVRLRLISSQPMPRKKVKENNQEKEVDDIERALRLESDGELTLGSEPIETTVNILVPKDLPQHPWALVLAAELLGSDGKTVESTAYSDARVLGF